MSDPDPIRPRLRVPVVIHQVDNPVYAAQDHSPLRAAWSEMLITWEQTDIDWEPRWISTPVATVVLEQAFENDANQPPSPPRQAHWRGLQVLPNYDPHVLNLFVLRDVPTVGTPPRSSYHQSHPGERLALISLRFPELTPRILQAALARLLGLGWDADKPADEFLKVSGSVTQLRADQQEKLRTGAAELQLGPQIRHNPITVDLHVHLVNNPTYGSRRTPEGVEQLVQGINRYWEQAGILFRAVHISPRHLSDNSLQSAFENRDQFVIAGRKTSSAALCSIPGYQPQAINLFCLGRVDLVGTTNLTSLQAWPYAGAKILLLADAADEFSFRRCASEMCNFFGIPRNQQAPPGSLRHFHNGSTLSGAEIEQVRQRAQSWTQTCTPPENQWLSLPLQVHRVTTPLTPAQVEALIQEVNQIWAQAGIQFTPSLVDTPLTSAEVESACPNDALHPPAGQRKGSFQTLRDRPEYVSGQLNLFLVDQVMSVGAPPAKMWATFEGHDGLASSGGEVVASKVVALTLGLQLGLQASNDLPYSLLMCNKVGAGLLLSDAHITSLRQAAAPFASARASKALQPGLTIPLCFHLVRSPGHTTNRDAQNLQPVVERLNRIWAPAGVVFQVHSVAPLELSDAEVEQAFPNSPTQPVAGRNARVARARQPREIHRMKERTAELRLENRKSHPRIGFDANHPIVSGVSPQRGLSVGSHLDGRLFIRIGLLLWHVDRLYSNKLILEGGQLLIGYLPRRSQDQSSVPRQQLKVARIIAVLRASLGRNDQPTLQGAGGAFLDSPTGARRASTAPVAGTFCRGTGRKDLTSPPVVLRKG